MKEGKTIKLPAGTIVKRTIRGKIRFYHQWREDGKTKSRYLRPAEVLPLREALNERKAAKGRKPPTHTALPGYSFNSAVIRGGRLDELAASVAGYGRRKCLEEILSFIGNSGNGGLLLLHGLAGCGKTTLLRQAIADMPARSRESCAYLSPPQGMTPGELFGDLYALMETGTKTVFIDAVERISKNPLPALYETFPALSLKIVAAVTDRPGAETKKTTYRRLSANIAGFRDYRTIAGTRDLDGYLRDGGDGETVLPENLEVALENLVGRFILEAIDARYRKNAVKPSNRTESDILKIARHLAEKTGNETDVKAISALERLELVVTSEGETFIAVPALRHRLVRRMVDRLLEDGSSAHLGAAEKKIVRDGILSAADDMALSETMLTETIRARAGGSIKVFRVLFPHGRFDIVVTDREELTCELYEVRNTDERTGNQLFNLADQIKLDTVEHRYGTITARELIYRGRNAKHSSGVAYRNAIDYLDTL